MHGPLTTELMNNRNMEIMKLQSHNANLSLYKDNSNLIVLVWWVSGLANIRQINSIPTLVT